MGQQSVKAFFAPKRSNGIPAAHPEPKKLKPAQDAAPKDAAPKDAAPKVATPARPAKPSTNSNTQCTNELARFSRGNRADPDFLESEARAKIHDQFVQRIGRPRRSKYQSETSHARALKPLDEQYIELKRAHMDTILLVEVGYKYKILGRDAQIASRVFGWTLMSGWLNIDEGDPVDALYDRFALCSFPTARLSFYVQKLVDAGHKVGIVNQTETSAIKASGDNKRGPFKREVTAIYTKGTFVDDLDINIKGNATPLSGHIMSIIENTGKHGPNEHEYGLVSVHPSTGDIIYDQFSDTNIATELETRLLHIQPCEILCIGSLSPSTRKLVNAVATRGKNSRVEYLQEPDHTTVAETEMEYSNISELPKLAQKACVALVEYLRTFKLTQVFSLDSYTPFTMVNHMCLNGNTLTSLEIFQNLTDYGPEGTLFWVIDQTRTSFGQRLLKKWVAQPLMNREALCDRVEAMKELITGYCDIFDRVKNVLSHLPDLELSLLQIHYARVTRRQLFMALSNFKKICSAYTIPELQSKKLKSGLLLEHFEALPTCREQVEYFLNKLDPVGAKEGDKMTFFLDDEKDEKVAPMVKRKSEIKELEQEFESYLAHIKTELKLSLSYTSFAGDEYLIEVKVGDTKKVPANWQKMNGTRALARYRTPETWTLVKRLNLAKERLEVEADSAYKSFVHEIADHYDQLRAVIVATANLDCLMSLAALSTRPGYVEVSHVDEPCIEITDGRHPIIDELLLDRFIPNDVSMTPRSSRAMIVTGPNMGGKSSFVRQVALITIMSQIGCFVPARKARLSLMDAVYTRMGAYDNMMMGESTFMVELNECSEILARATPKSLVLLDEIGRGTGTVDGMAIAYAVLYYIVSKLGCFSLFITHYPLLTELASLFPREVTNWCTDYKQDEATKVVTFLFKLVPGIAYRSYGLNVARLANIGPDILSEAEKKSRELEAELANRRTAYKLRELLVTALQGEEGGAAPALLEALEQSPTDTS